ncbi:MAG TPA: acetylxylan esterase [Terriglobales bacterium]|nr:acetylxylan esterase [Terriglobales bacterium]
MRLLITLLLGTLAAAQAQDAPPADVFGVLPAYSGEHPEITPYLKYQTEMAWREDDERRKVWEQIRTEADLIHVQEKLRAHLRAALGGLPEKKTLLNSRITGRIQMNGFHIEKLIFESLPGIYVTALLYVPEDSARKHPAILVPSGHSPDGKLYYQALCQRLVQRGYFVLSWDPVGQGERSQFWDAKNHKSHYNLICAEHAVLGNLAYLAGTNLARWEVWDGIRAVDYLLTRPEVDPERINITGTSGGGFQTALIAALDPRIRVVAPSCYITALPMRVYNRIFKDPDSDPEQDLDGMISSGLDHPGLLLLMYPRPVFVAAAVLDFFPIEGTHKTVREIAELYSRFGHPDRISMHESYNGHQYSLENQEAAFEFLDHFNQLPPRHELADLQHLEANQLLCTRSGQVMLEFENARSLMNEIRDYYIEQKQYPHAGLKEIYYSSRHPKINSWSVNEYKGAVPEYEEIRWEKVRGAEWNGVAIDRYLLHHSRYLQMPLLHIYKHGANHENVLLWLGSDGKAAPEDWPELKSYLDEGYDIISFDPRGLGETRMPYKAVSEDDPSLGQKSFDEAYVNPLSSVLADYVYNSLLTGRPYFLQMIDDAEIARRFAQLKLGASRFFIVGQGNASALASAAAETLPSLKLLTKSEKIVSWSELVDQKVETWPVQELLPGGAYIH